MNVPPLLRYLQAHDGLLVITFDENGFSGGPPLGCCTGGPGGQAGFGGLVGLVALPPHLDHAVVTHNQYDHASLLRTLEASFGIDEHLNNAATARPMADVFR